MYPSENLQVNVNQLRELKQLVAGGEGLHLEFKRRASSPDQIVREMIAFANTSGGVVLVGVNDDGDLSGVKYPEEESLLIKKALQKYCRPGLHFTETIIPLSGKKFVVQYEIPVSRKRPHIFLVSKKQSVTYIRIRDMSMKASREMSEIVRRGKQGKNVQFTYGDHESTLMRHLEKQDKITLPEFQVLTGLPYTAAAEKLITLVLANVLKITPTEKGDYYSRL
ncbi:MAG TPA: ATP-binding protein [Cyclobacteriaceae bacterium]|nr:ATP-binding protein [Cyclobacteriaceae bacterium]